MNRDRDASYLVIAPDVAAALDAGRPVVALESTIIAHGLPFPANLESARALEDEIRAAGATPATVAVLNGQAHVGLTAAALAHLAGGEAAGVRKLSRRDLAAAIALEWTGATTVSATMAVAALAGVRVFATGGIGGVHRGAAATMDISADLQELARTPLCVVCAGAKAILDLRLTLEYLETMAVPVLGYRTDVFPAFYYRESGLGVDARVEDAATVARLARAHWTLGLGGGPLLCVPAPAEAALARDEAESAIEAALHAARRAGIAGKAVTPYLLDAVREATGGRSLAANMALVRQNARVAAEVAVALCRVPPAPTKASRGVPSLLG